MEDIFVIKKKEYKNEEVISEFLFKVSCEGKFYIVRDLGAKTIVFKNFRYANKRLSSSGIKVPKVFMDKKQGLAVIEYIDGPTAFEELINHDFDDNIYEQLFTMNWKARVNGLQLDFNPQNFRIVDGILYYISFTFDRYIRAEDFSQNTFRLWMYTKDFREKLINEGIEIDKSRILSEFEENKKLVLTVVKNFK